MPDFPARRAKPRQVFGFTTFEGEQRELRADGGGIVRPQTSEDERILDGFDLPIAKAPAARKPSSSSKSRKAAKPPATAKPVERPADVVNPDAQPDGGKA